MQKKFEVNILNKKEMYNIGFTDYNKEEWYFCKSVCKTYPVTINFTINKKSKNCKICILDENFLQPYPYKKGDEVYNNAKKWIDYMINKGVLLNAKEN